MRFRFVLGPVLIGLWCSLAAAAAPDPPGWWSFQPLRRSAPPAAKAPSVGPVDRFVNARLAAQRIQPAPALDRRRLIRRLYFDLVGLPPAPEEIDAFVKDNEPAAYEKWVDRLLADPRFGERWGRHWLDVARYADSNGQEGDQDRPNAYHYRDFVIRAFNEDLPYDAFVRWQLAGDEYEPDNPRAVSATGFVVAGPHTVLDVPMEEEKYRNRLNELDDMIATTGSAFLGLTVACARCHNHKYDPIPISDYYRLQAAFNAGDRKEIPLVPRAEAERFREAERQWKERLEAVRKATGDVKAVEAQKPAAPPMALAMADFGGKPRETWLLDRGDLHLKKEPVELGFLTALTPRKPAAEYWKAARAGGGRTDTTYQRRALADWMTDTRDGAGALLARVIVNRLWQHHFGEGLVRTVNDFGTQGEEPTHPELLEWLASELVRRGISDVDLAPLKPIHRLMLTSQAYRRGGFPPTHALRNTKADPESKLLWRRRAHRVESEVYRDSMLAVAGTLNPKMYGAAFKPPLPREAIQARNLKSPYPADAKDTPETRRRSVYMFHKRVVQHPLMQVFDGPDAAASCGRRVVTTVAPQALAVLNEPFIRLRAREFAERLRKEAGEAPASQVKRAYLLALGREPSATELQASTAFLEQAAVRRTGRGEKDALVDFAQVVFGLNEFMYVD